MMTQNNELKNMMANFFQMQHQNQNQSTSGSGSLPSNTVANPRGELQAITTRSGVSYDGPSVPIPPLFINLEENEREAETSTDPIVIQKLPEKLGDHGKFLIPCSFSELKCQALADLGASINLMSLSVWKRLGLPELIPTRMTLELANRMVCGRQKEIYYAHNDVEDLIESALNSKLLSIKSKSQRLIQEKQEVKNIAEPAAKRRTYITSCLQNFKVINKESIIPLNNTPQISPVNAITHDLPSECDLPVNYEFSLTFTTFSNPLFDSNNDFSSSDDESLSNEDFDYLLEEFSGEFAHIDLIPLKIVDTDFKPEEEIRLAENLSYDNSSPRPPEELNAEIADTIVESLSPPPIPVEDSDSLMEEIDLFLASDDSDFDPEGEIHLIERLLYDNSSPCPLEYLSIESFSPSPIPVEDKLLSNDSSPLPENESSNLDHVNDPSSPRPPSKPPDDDIFETEPDTGVLTAKDCPDFEDSRARCFVHRPLDLQSFACLYWGFDILNLID
ncbi:reverse transcriptase domain-containing protein [Tanacetum coccineum]